MEFSDLNLTPLASWGIGGVLVAILWPVVRQLLSSFMSQSRTEHAMLSKAIEERDKAQARADAAEGRADELFKQLQEIRTELRIMTFKLEISEKQLTELRDQLAQLLQESHK